MSPAREQPCLKDVVLGATARPGRRGALIAGIAAGILHVGAGAVAFALGAPTERPVKRKSQPLVVVDHVVELAPEPEEAPPPPEPPPVEEPPPPPPKPKPKVKLPKAEPKAKAEAPPAPEQEAPPPAEEPPSEPPPAAQAAQVVAAQPSAESAPPAFDIATGQGSNYAGGTTSASGTGTQANHTGQVGVGNGTGRSRARPAQLRSRNWPCGWPPEAEDLDLEEAYVTVRASVRPDGSLEDVQVLSDPGHGFGRRAVWCARSKVRFDPALDDAGNPVAGLTPPLRVRFIREE